VKATFYHSDSMEENKSSQYLPALFSLIFTDGKRRHSFPQTIVGTTPRTPKSKELRDLPRVPQDLGGQPLHRVRMREAGSLTKISLHVIRKCFAPPCPAQNNHVKNICDRRSVKGHRAARGQGQGRKK